MGQRAAWGRGRSAAVVLGGMVLAACADGAPTSSSEAGSLDAAAVANGWTSLHENAAYVAELRPLNPRAQARAGDAQGAVTGKAYFRLMNGQLHAMVDARNVEPADASLHPLEGLHPQHIHEADRCPTASDDANGDGYVDVIEGLPKYGPIMVPLDANLNDTTSQVATFPFGTAQGSFSYAATGSAAALVAVLGHPLDLPRRHVVVHGVSLATVLPPSVQSLPGVPAQLTLPVACGEIREVR